MRILARGEENVNRPLLDHLSLGNLPSLCIDGVMIPYDQLGDGDQLEAFLFQCGKQLIQGFGGVFPAVVAEYDRAVAEMLVLCDTPYNGGGVIVLPVEAVNIRYKSQEKFLRGG